MRIFNPNAPVIFSGPVLGRSAEPFEFEVEECNEWLVGCRDMMVKEVRQNGF